MVEYFQFGQTLNMVIISAIPLRVLVFLACKLKKPSKFALHFTHISLKKRTIHLT